MMCEATTDVQYMDVYIYIYVICNWSRVLEAGSLPNIHIKWKNYIQITFYFKKCASANYFSDMLLYHFKVGVFYT